MKKEWIDISITLKNGMAHWPSDPPVVIKRTKDMEKGDKNNLSHISMSSHTGTHMDAPLHFIRTGKSLDCLPLETVIGLARVIEIKNKKYITAEELHRYRICAGERILFKTTNSQRCWKRNNFVTDFVYITAEAAEYLVQRDVLSVGVDYLSVGGYQKNGAAVHNILLAAGIWLIEGLDLGKVKQGNYDLICLPLKIFNSDGAPARAILRKR